VTPSGYERMVPAPRLPPVLDAGPPAAPAAAIPEVLGSMTAFLAQVSAAHREYLARSAELHARFLASRRFPAPVRSAPPTIPMHPGPKLASRELEELASGSVASVFGPAFADLDGPRRRLRLPMPPFLFVDRVTGIEGVPGSMGPGAIWTETDVLDSSWYLDDCGRIPHGVLQEAAQGVMVLLGWLGADRLHDGDRVYRMVGIDGRFLDERPAAGETLAFEARLDRHARLGDALLIFASASVSAGGRTRASGSVQAGFFREEDLARPAGAPWTPAADRRTLEGPCDPPLRRSRFSSFTREQVQAFANSRAAECFGEGFERTEAHVRTPKIPAGRILMLEEVEAFDPGGGPWGRGYLRASRAISPDEWFFPVHFLGDPCMPGALMTEGAMQAMGFYLAAMGFTVSRDAWRFDLALGCDYALRWRGQVTPETRRIVFELFVESVTAGPEPTVVADVVMNADGRQSFHARRLRMRLVPDLPLEHWRRSGRHRQQETGEPVPLARLGGLVGHRDQREAATRDGFAYGQESLLAAAWGRPSRAFGPAFERCDGIPGLPHLPGPPYAFLSRITAISAEPGAPSAGSAMECEYDVPPRVWYFEENGAPTMPWAVFLETMLQACGWLSVFTSLGPEGSFAPGNLFRNLDGSATLGAEVLPSAGTLRTRVRLETYSKLGNLTLFSFSIESLAEGGLPVAKASAEFGFFPPESFEAQVGLRPTEEERDRLAAPSDVRVDLRERPARYFAGPLRLPGPMLLMLHRVTGFWPDGGRAGLGFLRAERDVDPGDWYFKAHFFDDPVQPGSLGLEGVCQLLQLYAIETGLGDGLSAPRFEAPMLGREITWKYRGQVLPENRRVVTELEITEVGRDERGPFAVGEGWLWVDGLRVYHVSGLGVRVLPGSAQADGSLSSSRR